MRRLLLSALAVIGLLSLAACTGTPSPSPATPSPTPPAESPAGSPAESPTGSPAESPAESPAGAACSETDDVAVSVSIASFTFSPDPVQASVGEGIGWTNEDSVPHTATLDDGSCGTDRLGNGDTGALVFMAPGTYPYHCEVHPNMTGTIEISD